MPHFGDLPLPPEVTLTTTVQNVIYIFILFYFIYVLQSNEIILSQQDVLRRTNLSSIREAAVDMGTHL